MYEQLVEAIQEEGSRLASLQRSSIDALQKLVDVNGTVMSLSGAISDGDRSVSDIDTLTSSLVKFTKGFDGGKNWSFVPRVWISEYRDALKNTANSYENLANNIEAIDSQHGGLEKIDEAAFSVATKSGTEIDLRKILSNISVNIDTAFADYFRIRPAISAPRLTEFSDLFSFFATRRNELDSLSRELSKLGEQGRESSALIQKAAQNVSAAENDIRRLTTEATKQRAEIQTAVDETSEKVASIEEINKSAEELKSAVNSYRSTFDQFQKDINSRNTDYANKKTAYEKLKASLDKEQQRIAEISAQADDMLKGATNAGLAGSYSSKQIGIEKEIKKARLAYYISIGLLVFLTLPIFIYSFPREYISEIFKHIFNFDLPNLLARDTSQTEYQQIINFIGRAVFLIPGLMLVRFASSRHERLFRLREDYAYKYSIASSVDGFMKQAKTYADDIAAACYFELTYNPADRMDEKADDARLMNPLFERMLARLENKLIKGRKGKRPTDPLPSQAA